MRDILLSVLGELGMVDVRCGCCDMVNWILVASTSDDTVLVTCQTCGREYQSMGAKQRYSYFANMAGKALVDGRGIDATRYHNLMLQVWHSYNSIADHPPVLVLMYDGDPQKSDDHDLAL